MFARVTVMVLACLLALSAVVAVSYARKKKDAPVMTTVEAGFQQAQGGLQFKDDVLGEGTEAKAGQMVTVHYTGTLTDGSKFDSSKDRGQPFAFALGAGQVIKGWDVGVAGMKVGGTRTLLIPADMGYGDRGFPPVIPGNATLKFVVELLGVE
jgi:FKBP-type peptidyl-prolyl cis-trans isomerase FkpA